MKEMTCLVVISLSLLSLCACAIADLDTTPSAPAQIYTGKIIEPIMAFYRSCRNRVNPNRTVTEDRNKPEVLCAELPGINECLLQEEDKWNQSHSAPESKVFVIYRQLWEATMNRLCDNYAEKFTTLMSEQNKAIKSFDAREKITFYFGLVSLHNCIMSLFVIDLSRADLASKVWSIYNQIRNHRDTVERYMDMGVDNIRHLKEETTAMLEIMKCLRPQDGEVVLCSQVNSTLIDRTRRICNFQRENTVSSVNEFLVKESVGCVKVGTLRSDLSRAQSLKRIKRYFQNYCRNRWESFINCQALLGTTASLCLPVSDFEKFKLIQLYLDLVLEKVCAGEDAEGLTTLFNRFKVVNNVTGKATLGMMDCLQGTLVGESGSLDVNGYYNELPQIRQCLLDSVSGDTAFKTVLDGMYGGIRDNMKCLSPTDGRVGLCKHVA